MCDFLRVTEEALVLHEKLMAVDMAQWQAEARERFDVMRSKLAPCL